MSAVEGQAGSIAGSPEQSIIPELRARMTPVYRRTATWRWVHWINALAIIGCTVTGIFIADPFFVAKVSFLMAWNRAIHLYFATILDLSLILLAYLYVFSRAERSVLQLIPNRENLHSLKEALLNFVLLGRRKRFDTAKPDSFNAVLFLLLHAMILIQMLTGLQLYVENEYAGMSSIGGWWPSLLHASTDWTLSVFGGVMGVRYAHLTIMYFVIAWFACHIYYEIWRTAVWGEGDVTIAFAGRKFARLRPGAGTAAARGAASAAGSSAPAAGSAGARQAGARGRGG